MPKIHIDEHEIEVGERENLIDAARRANVHIPHFCYHPALSVAGNCRQCLVEIEGVAKPQIACNTPVRDGMVIKTKGAAIEEARRGVLEFLLLNHPIDCPICDQAGECRLQEYYMSHGLYDSRRNVDKVHKPKMVDLGPYVVLDAERCVLCTRCVRFCDEVAGVDELYVKERGHESEIATFPGRPLENPYSANVVDVCPVGALLNRDFRFKSRVWWLKKADSVCTGCARGCNMRIDHHWNQVQRLVPRFNPEVNQYWMCDRGRHDYAWMNDNRVTDAQRGTQQISLRDGLDALCERLQQLDGDVTVLLSPKLANEDLLALRHVFRSVYPAQVLGGGSLEPPQPEDEILRKADPHPNSAAVRALGLEADAGAAIRDGATRGLVIWGDDPLGWDPSLASALLRYEFVAAALTNHNATAEQVVQRDGLLLPLATHAEYAGSFTNFEGRVQRFEPALSLYGSALPAYEMAIEIANTLRREFWRDAANKPSRTDDVLAQIWAQLVPEGSTLPALDWNAVPPHGLAATARRTARPRSVMVGDAEQDAHSWYAMRSNSKPEA